NVFGEIFAGRILENVEALRVGLHHAVLDSVVNHLDEMSSAGGAAMNVTFFRSTCRCARHFLASRSAGNVAASRSQGFENGIKALDGILGTADHHAVAAIDPPYPS